MVQFPNTTSASGVWNMTDVYNNRLGGTWPPGPLTGDIGIWGGFVTPSISSSMQYITITSAGNATNFGNLTVARGYVSGLNNAVRGVFAGAQSPILNVMDFITIASTGNGTDFGDLSTAGYSTSGASNANAGVQ